MSYGTTLTLGNTGVAATEYLTRYFSLTDRLYDEQDQLLLNTPEALEALRLLLDARPCVQPSYSNWWRETAKAFAAGDTAERKFLNIMGLQIMHAINGFVEPATAVKNMQKEMERII